MTLKFCDICGSNINVKYTVEISEHTPLELCNKCWKCAWIHFETLKKRYKEGTKE